MASNINVKVQLKALHSDSLIINLDNKILYFSNDYENEFYPMFNLTSENGFIFTKVNNYVHNLGVRFSSYEQAIAYKDNFNPNAVIKLEATGEFSLLIDDTHSIGQLAPINLILISDGIRPLLLFEQTSIKVLDDDFIKLGDRHYRGSLELTVSSEGINIVNILDLEEYLYSVLPSEMPSSFPLEALKAQAVAARTRILKRLSSDKSYVSTDTVLDQVYLGAGVETEITTEAVIATKDSVIYYDNQPIYSVFFSSSGGHTEDSEEVWINDEPYLRGIEDYAENEHKSWTYSIPFKQIETALSIININIGSISSASIIKNDNNRVSSLTFVGELGEYSLSKENIREFFAYTDAGVLDSRYFDIDTNNNTEHEVYIMSKDRQALPVKRSISAITTDKQISTVNISGLNILSNIGITNIDNTVHDNLALNITGKGYGHGVGLSQYGAKGMAQAGFDYKSILKHYYTGVNIT